MTWFRMACAAAEYGGTRKKQQTSKYAPSGLTTSIQPKLDQEITESLDSAVSTPAWSPPALKLRIGLSTRSPFMGLMKTHAGTKPICTLSPLLSTLAESREGLNMDNEEREGGELFCATRHQPSSNDCRTWSCSPKRERGSSSGSTGWKNWRTGRAWGVADDREDSRECKERKPGGSRGDERE